MQLNDRQSSHAQASSTASQTTTRPVSFRKACSPDIPEPPHKKGSGQSSSFEAHKQPEHQLRRKLPEGLVRKSPTASPKAATAEISMKALKDSLTNGHSTAGEAEERNETPSPKAEGSESEQGSPVRKESSASEYKNVFAMYGSHRGRKEAAPQKRSQDTELTNQLNLAKLLGGRGNFEAAQQIAEKLYALHPFDADVLCLRGQCYAALSKRAQVCNSALLNKGRPTFFNSSEYFYSESSIMEIQYAVSKAACQATPCLACSITVGTTSCEIICKAR